jgi:hypothetical protein
VSWTPITMYAIQCDSTTPTRCTEQYQVPDKDDDSVPTVVALWDRPEFGPYNQLHMREAGWLRTPDGRDLCSRHAKTMEHMALASLEGLSFEEGEPRG